MHFGTKSYLKSTRNHTVKHALKQKEKEKGQKKEKKKLERHACNLHEHQGFKRVYPEKSLGPT